MYLLEMTIKDLILVLLDTSPVGTNDFKSFLRVYIIVSQRYTMYNIVNLSRGTTVSLDINTRNYRACRNDKFQIFSLKLLTSC